MRSINRPLTALFAAITLAGCANMEDMSQSFTELTTSSLVGTWAGEYQCMGKYKYRSILSFRQSKVPLIAEGQYYNSIFYPTHASPDYFSVQIDGEVSLAGQAYINKKAWIVKPAGNFLLSPWSGKRTAPDTLEMTMKDCGATFVLRKVSDEFISELDPRVVFEMQGHLLKHSL